MDIAKQCKWCGKPLTIGKWTTVKKFCGAVCRDTYWNAAKSKSVKRGEWRKRRWGEPLAGFALEPSAAGYVAGFMDGEGHIGVVREHRKANTSGFRYKLLVEFANTNQEVLNYIRSLLKGNGYLSGARNDHKFPNAKPLFKLRLTTTQARGILPVLLPYLVVKRRVAELALTFLQRLDEMPMRASRDHEALDAMWLQFKVLNKRGR